MAPSSVIFLASGPQVSSGANATQVSDLWIDCNDSLYSLDHAGYLTPGGGTQMAVVSGKPDGATCDNAVKRAPLSATVIFYAQLHPGMEFCLIPSLNQDQLVFLKLLSSSTTTYDLSWSATAWAVPQGG
jgi:hypothetical protein